MNSNKWGPTAYHGRNFSFPWYSPCNSKWKEFQLPFFLLVIQKCCWRLIKETLHPLVNEPFWMNKKNFWSFFYHCDCECEFLVATRSLLPMPRIGVSLSKPSLLPFHPSRSNRPLSRRLDRASSIPSNNFSFNTSLLFIIFHFSILITFIHNFSIFVQDPSKHPSWRRRSSLTLNPWSWESPTRSVGLGFDLSS